MMIDLDDHEVAQLLGLLGDRPGYGQLRDKIEGQVLGDEPRFVLRAQDLLAMQALVAYRAACAHAGLTDQQFEVSKAMVDMGNWQVDNPTRLKLPDHKHRSRRPLARQ